MKTLAQQEEVKDMTYIFGGGNTVENESVEEVPVLPDGPEEVA